MNKTVQAMKRQQEDLNLGPLEYKSHVLLTAPPPMSSRATKVYFVATTTHFKVVDLDALRTAIMGLFQQLIFIH